MYEMSVSHNTDLTVPYLPHYSVMYNAYNSKLFQDTNEPVGPRPSASPFSFIFFLLYMCTMTLVLLNMFIGFVIVTFQEVGIKAFRESKLDRNQVRMCCNLVCINLLTLLLL